MTNGFPFFETLDHRVELTDDVGRRVRFTAHRAVVWHDGLGRSLSSAHYHTFVVVGYDDEDDMRVLPALQLLYAAGWLPAVLFIGWREGTLIVLHDSPPPFAFDPEAERRYRSFVYQTAREAPTDDMWTARVDTWDSHEHRLMLDPPDHVTYRLAALRRQWALGLEAAFR